MSLKTQNQERAKFVLEYINFLKASNYSQKLSAFILTNGLLPTLAFLQSKDDGKVLYKVIEKYLTNKLNINNQNKNLIEVLANGDSILLRLATKEVMELANWIRRLVESESEMEEKKNA